MITVICGPTEKKKIRATKGVCGGLIDCYLDLERTGKLTLVDLIREYIKFPYQALIINNVKDLDVDYYVAMLSDRVLDAWIPEKHSKVILPKMPFILVVKTWPCDELVKQLEYSNLNFILFKHA